MRDFLRGASLIFDFGGTIGQKRISTARTPSDAERLAGDWNAVGEDLHRAIGSHRHIAPPSDLGPPARAAGDRF